MELLHLSGGINLKKLIGLLLLSMILVLGAFSGTGMAKGKKITTNDVIQSFKDAGLEVGKVKGMDKKEFGNIRKDGKRILIPSLGDDAGGRLMSFKNKKDLETAKSYYVTLGNAGPMFFSHTHQSGLFLLQMNGDMEDAEFEKYVKAMDAAVK